MVGMVIMVVMVGSNNSDGGVDCMGDGVMEMVRSLVFGAPGGVRDDGGYSDDLEGYVERGE